MLGTKRPMCELLVRIVDKPLSGDPAVDCHRTRRGDVIDVRVDGAGWTPREMTNPDWVILSVPGMSLEEGQSLTVGEPRGPQTPLARRLMFRLDLDALSVVTGGVRYEVPVGRLRGVRSRKPAAVDPNVIG